MQHSNERGAPALLVLLSVLRFCAVSFIIKIHSLLVYGVEGKVNLCFTKEAACDTSRYTIHGIIKI